MTGEPSQPGRRYKYKSSARRRRNKSDYCHSKSGICKRAGEESRERGHDGHQICISASARRGKGRETEREERKNRSGKYMHIIQGKSEKEEREMRTSRLSSGSFLPPNPNSGVRSPILDAPSKKAERGRSSRAEEAALEEKGDRQVRRWPRVFFTITVQ